MKVVIDQTAVKRLRIAAKLNMEEAAVRAHMRTRHDWNKIENGITKDPRVSTVYWMAQALGCPMEDLLIKPRK